VGHRVGVVIVAAIAPAVLLVVDPSGWYWFGPVKWLVVTTALPLAAAALWHRTPVTVVRLPTVAAVALVGALAIAAIRGADPLYAWTGTPERHLGVLTWLLCLLGLVVGQSLPMPDARLGADRGPHLDARDDSTVLLAAGLATAGLGVGGVATAEALGWEPLVLDVGGRLSGTLGSSAYLGAVCALLLPACVGVALERSLPRPTRAIAAVAAPMVCVATVGAGARAAWVGLLAAGALLVVGRRAWLRARPRLVAIGGACGAAVLVAVLVLTPAGARVGSTFDAGEPGGRGRLDEWRVATRVIADRPLLGVGPEGYRIAFADGADDAYERAHGRDLLPDRAHSAPLDVTLAGGVLALGAWLAFVSLTGRHAWRALRGANPWIAGLATGLVAYQLAQLLLFPIGEIEPIVWLLAGVSIAATSRPAERSERAAATVVVPALAIVAALALTAGVLDVAADRAAREAVDALADGDPARAADAAADATSLRPDEVRLHLLESRAVVADRQGTLAALRSVRRALDRSPDDPVALLTEASLLVDRAQATLVPEHITRARDAVDELLRNDPHRAALWMLAGTAARLDGDVGAAESAWQRAEQLAPHDPAPPASLAVLYVEHGRTADAADAVARALALDQDDATAQAVRRQLALR
jgi:cytochrome c-type biogenesis protein CcmH/NrfG